MHAYEITLSYPALTPPAGSYDYLFKYIVVGDTGVGKSSLLKRQARGEWDDAEEQNQDFMINTLDPIDGKVAKLQLWDTRGAWPVDRQLRLRGMRACIVCYDCSDASSMHRASDLLGQARTKAEKEGMDNLVYAIMGCKSDLCPNADWHPKPGDYPGVDVVCKTSARAGEGVAASFLALTQSVLAAYHADAARPKPAPEGRRPLNTEEETVRFVEAALSGDVERVKQEMARQGRK